MRRLSVAVCLAALVLWAALLGPSTSAAAGPPLIKSTPTISADIPSRVITAAFPVG